MGFEGMRGGEEFGRVDVIIRDTLSFDTEDTDPQVHITRAWLIHILC